jgi:ATPase subunit of ABC transporter with duplicated ATPase domains
VYKGRYADYLAQREQMIAQAEAAFYEQKAEMRRLQSYIRQKAFSPKKAPPPSDGDKLLYNAKAATHERTVSKQLREAKHRLGDLQENPLSHPDRLWRVRLDFQPDPLPSQEALRLAGLSKAYGERVLFQNITLSLRRGERVALVGPNGAGKSTLLRIILGLEAADSGRVDWAPQAKPGYLAQDNRDLDPTQTVLAAYAAALPKEKSEAEMLADLHRGGLFSTDLLDGKLAGDLSLGQGRKLGLARLIGARANVLLLDEPSNHLDFTALEALEAALQSFTGAVLLASHDRWLIERVATRRWCLGEGGIIEEEL